MSNIKDTELFKAMKSSGDYENDECILDTIEEMRQEVLDGRDPEEVLYEEGLEPDYILDLIS